MSGSAKITVDAFTVSRASITNNPTAIAAKINAHATLFQRAGSCLLERNYHSTVALAFAMMWLPMWAE
jgi:hypothetical protein